MGRKKVADKKKQVPVFIEESKIELVGGMSEAQKIGFNAITEQAEKIKSEQQQNERFDERADSEAEGRRNS